MSEWSTDTRDLVAATIAAHYGDTEICAPNRAILLCGGCDYEDVFDHTVHDPHPAFAAHRADAVLTALTDAGALLPAGGDKYDHYRHANGSQDCVLAGGSEEFVHLDRNDQPNPLHRHTHVRHETSWPDGAVYYGP